MNYIYVKIDKNINPYRCKHLDWNAGLNVNLNITSPYTQLAPEGGKNEITHNYHYPEPAERGRNSTSRAAYDAATERIETIGKCEVFVKTKVVGKICDILKDFATILQVGNPGQGKTENCIYMMYAVCKGKIGGFGTDWVPYIVTTVKELKKVLNNTEKQIILVDDFLGRTNFIESRLQDWLTYFETKRKFDKRYTRLMFTSRKHIFQIASDRLKEYELIMSVGNIVDLTQSSLDQDEKRDILNRYLKKACIKKSHEVASPVGESSFSITESTVTKIVDCDVNDILGFPLCCKTFVSNPNFLVQKEDFFTKPTKSLANEIEKMSENDTVNYIALVYLLLSGGRVHLENFDSFSASVAEKQKVEEISEACGKRGLELRKIRKAADSLMGSFLTREGSFFSYIHESLMDAVCVCFGKNHGGKAVEHCSIDVLVEFVRTPRHQSEEKIIVHDKIEEIFIWRLYKALIDTDSANKIMCHDSFDDEQFAERFFEAMKGSGECLNSVLCMKDENRNSFLAWACKLGRVKLFECLLKSGANIEEEMTDGSTIFHLACVCERKEIIDCLVKHLGPGSNTMLCPNRSGKTPLHLACQLGLVDIVKILLKHGAEVVISDKDRGGRTALFYACGNTPTDDENFSIIMGLLLEHGAASDIDVSDNYGKTPLHRASILRKVDIMRRMLACLPLRSNAIHRKDRGERTPLHLACKHNAWLVAELLLGKGAMSDAALKDRDGRTPLHSACVGGFSETVDVLLKHVSSQRILDEDLTGKMALHLACIKGSEVIVGMLLQYSTNVNSTDKHGRSPLHLACKYAGASIVDMLLLTKRVNSEEREDEDGNTPLHMACRADGVDIVKSLLGYGVNVNTKNHGRKTPLHMAFTTGSESLVRTLLQCSTIDVNAVDCSGKTPFDLASSDLKEKLKDLIQ
ncbi:hypothetical protein ScPMuIL_002734 [Solemya velum]